MPTWDVSDNKSAPICLFCSSYGCGSRKLPTNVISFKIQKIFYLRLMLPSINCSRLKLTLTKGQHVLHYKFVVDDSRSACFYSVSSIFTLWNWPIKPNQISSNALVGLIQDFLGKACSVLTTIGEPMTDQSFHHIESKEISWLFLYDGSIGRKLENIYLFKINSINSKKRCEICSKLNVCWVVAYYVRHRIVCPLYWLKLAVID